MGTVGAEVQIGLTTYSGATAALYGAIGASDCKIINEQQLICSRAIELLIIIACNVFINKLW